MTGLALRGSRRWQFPSARRSAWRRQRQHPLLQRLDHKWRIYGDVFGCDGKYDVDNTLLGSGVSAAQVVPPFLGKGINCSCKAPILHFVRIALGLLSVYKQPILDNEFTHLNIAKVGIGGCLFATPVRRGDLNLFERKSYVGRFLIPSSSCISVIQRPALHRMCSSLHSAWRARQNAPWNSLRWFLDQIFIPAALFVIVLRLVPSWPKVDIPIDC